MYFIKNQDCNKLAYKNFRIEQDDQDEFSEFLKRIKVQQRRKSRIYLDNLYSTADKEITLKEHLVAKYVKLHDEIILQRRRNQNSFLPCLKKKPDDDNGFSDLMNKLNYKFDDRYQNYLQKSVFNNENLFGYYYKRKEDSTYSKSFKIHLQLIDFYNEPSIAIFFEDETPQNDLFDVKLKKRKQQQLIVSTLNQVREKVSQIVILFRDQTEEYIVKQTKEMAVVLLNQTYNLFDYIYLKERKKLIQKQQQLQPDESTYKEQNIKCTLNLNFTEFSLKSLLNDLYLINPLIDIVYQDQVDDSKSQINENQNLVKYIQTKDIMIFNDYKRILQVLISLNFQTNIIITIKQIKEALFQCLEFTFKYEYYDSIDHELETQKIEGRKDQMQATPSSRGGAQYQSNMYELELNLNKNQTDKQLKEIDLYVIKCIVKEVGPNSLEINKTNNTVSFRIFINMKVLQQEDDIKNMKNSIINFNNQQKREKYLSTFNHTSQKSIIGLISQQNTSFCKTEARHQDNPQNTSPVHRNTALQQQGAQSPQQQFKIELKDQSLKKARRSNYSRTLPPQNQSNTNNTNIIINFNNVDSPSQTQSNLKIIEQHNQLFINSELNLFSQTQLNEQKLNSNIKESDKISVKQIISHFSDSNKHQSNEMSPQNTLEEGEDLPDVKMTKYQKTQ